ncbi:MAG: TolC family protein [Caulobacteraceae bacterium]
MRFKSKVWVSIAASALVAACAPTTHLSEPKVGLPQAYDSPATAVAAKLPAAALDTWWTLFNDPQLTALVDEALAASPDSRSALARLTEARATRDQALSVFWPQGNLSASANTQNNRQTFGSSGGFQGFSPGGQNSTLSASFNPTWELDLYGGIRTARRGANADLAAARFDYEATRMSIAAEVATSLFQARGLAVQLDDARDNARITRDLANLGGKKSQYGFGTTADTARLESQAKSSEADVLRIEAAMAGAKRSLLVLAGRGAAPLDSVKINAVVAGTPPIPEATPGELLARRPDVREAEERLVSATVGIQLQKLQLFPNLQLKPGLQLSRTSGASDSTSRLWQLGIGATVPILDRPKLLAQIRQQTARAEQAVSAYEKAVQSAYSDAEKSMTNLKSDQDRSALLTDAEKSSRFAFDAATKGYRAGLTDLTTLLQAEQGWRAAKTALTNLQTTTLVDSVTVFKSLGGGWTPVTPEIAGATRVAPL